MKTARELIESMPEAGYYDWADFGTKNRDSIRTALLAAERAEKAEALLRATAKCGGLCGFCRHKIDAYLAESEGK